MRKDWKPKRKSRTFIQDNRRRKPSKQKPRQTTLKVNRFLLSAGEIEKARFVNREGLIVTFARRNTAPRSWWFVNWIQNRYQPSGPFTSYADAWAYAAKKLRYGTYVEADWKLIAHFSPCGNWERVINPPPPPLAEVLRRLEIRERWEYNRILRIKRGCLGHPESETKENEHEPRTRNK